MPPAEKAFLAVRRSPKRSQPSNEGRRPGTIFNERATWPNILEAYGWTWVKRIGEEDFWRRPGKDVGISATTNYEGSDLLYIFSTSTPGSKGVGISKFAAYTFLEHQGNFSEATKALVAQGYVEEENHASVHV
jgi:putative DNA primase/helicase